MQTFTLGLGIWMRRLLARNPLVRISDRIEAIAVFGILTVALLAAPVAGAAGTAVHDSLVHTYAIAQLDRHQIRATATRDSRSAPQAYEKPFLTQIQWQAAGATHSDEIRSGDMKAGQQLDIWVNTAGERTTAPPTDRDAAAQAVVAALAVWSTAVGVAVAAWAALRLRLDRLRYSAWDRELDDLADNGGRTNKNA